MIPESAIIQRKLNARPDYRKHAPIDALAHRLGWSKAGFTPVNYNTLAGDPRDQGGHGSCEAESHGKAIMLRMKIAGTPLGFEPSDACLYAIARAIERGGKSAPLDDEGSTTFYIGQAFNLWGVIPMRGPVQDPDDPGPRNSDVDNSTVNAEPNFADLEAASTNLFVGQYSCEGTSEDNRIDSVNMALSAGYPPTIGGFVDTNYMRWEASDGVYQRADKTDPNGGGHSQLIVGNRLNSAGEPEYLILNSWGPWCQNGRVWVSKQFILDAWEITAMSVKRAS